MDISDAQREMRIRFAGGFYGQLVSGMLWLVSANLATLSYAPSSYHDAGSGRIFHLPGHRTAHPCFWTQESAERAELP